MRNNYLNQFRQEKKSFREFMSEYKNCNDGKEKLLLKKRMGEIEEFLATLKSSLGFKQILCVLMFHFFMSIE